MVCLIQVLCYAMTTCFELYIKTCYHITFSASQAFAWWSWGYGCYWFLFHECLLFTSHHTGQTPLEVFQGKSVRWSPARKIWQHSEESCATVWWGGHGVFVPPTHTLVIDSTHSWAGCAFLWRMVSWSIIMYYLVPLPAQCLIVHGKCSADVCAIEVMCLFNVLSITLWVLWSQGLCVTCLCVLSSTQSLAYNASLLCSHRIPIHLSKIVQIPPSLRWALF